MTSALLNITKDLRNYPFFAFFTDALLEEITAFIQIEIFKPGQIILQEGQKNNNLYFLKEGAVEVLVAEVPISLLQKSGEVFGEMSVVTKLPVVSSIRAAQDTKVYILNSEKIAFLPSDKKDHIENLMYRIYINILADRLTKTNEKARLFELANRDLHQAQVGLQALGNRTVLLVQSDKKQLVMAKVAVGGTGVKLDTSSDQDTALQMLRANKYDALICDESCFRLLVDAKNEDLVKNYVLITNNSARKGVDLLEHLPFVDNVISIDQDKRTDTIRSVLVTLTKVLNKDLFGLEKYLNWGVDCQQRPIIRSGEREALRNEMLDYFRKIGIRTTFLERINAVAEEMLMNAIYDSPTDAQGKAIYNHLSRREEVTLEKNQQGLLRYASDGLILAVSVSDPFGALGKNIIVRYLKNCYAGSADLNENRQDKGGAGRGLHQIIEHSDLTVFNIKSGSRTEVISLFHIEGAPKNINPAFNYFFI